MIFINKATIHWYSNNQPLVDTSTFITEFCAMKVGVDMVEAFRYKVRTLGIPLDSAANVFCDNESVYKNTSMLESTLQKKHQSIA